MSKWVKTTEFGDYTQTPDRIARRTNRNVHIIREARALRVAGKHAGSKPTGRLLKGIAKVHEAMAFYKKAQKAAEEEKSGEE